MYARSAGNSADQLRRVVPCRWSAPETTHDTVEAAQRTLPAPRYVPKDAKILPVPWYMLVQGKHNAPTKRDVMRGCALALAKPWNLIYACAHRTARYYATCSAVVAPVEYLESSSSKVLDSSTSILRDAVPAAPRTQGVHSLRVDWPSVRYLAKEPLGERPVEPTRATASGKVFDGGTSLCHTSGPSNRGTAGISPLAIAR